MKKFKIWGAGAISGWWLMFIITVVSSTKTIEYPIYRIVIGIITSIALTLLVVLEEK